MNTPYRNVLLRFIRKRLLFREPADAEDVLQEVYLRVAKNPALIAAANNEEAYYFGIAKHAIGDYLQEKLAQDKHESHDSDDENLEEKPAPYSMERIDRIIELRQLLGELSEGQRQVILLHKVYGMSYEEVSEYLGYSIHTVEKYVTISLRKLRERVDAWKSRPIGHGAGTRSISGDR